MERTFIEFKYIVSLKLWLLYAQFMRLCDRFESHFYSLHIVYNFHLDFSTSLGPLAIAPIEVGNKFFYSNLSMEILGVFMSYVFVYFLQVHEFMCIHFAYEFAKCANSSEICNNLNEFSEKYHRKHSQKIRDKRKKKFKIFTAKDSKNTMLCNNIKSLRRV